MYIGFETSLRFHVGADRILNGNTYTDSEFGHHYALDKSGDISPEDKEEVFIRLKEWLNR